MKRLKAYIALFSAVVLMAGIVLQVFPTRTVEAAQITNRSLTLQAGGGGDGGSKPGGTVNHLFTFTLPTVGGGSTNDVGSIKFQYCTTAAPVPLGIGCVAPAGISVSGVTLGNESGATGFTGMDKVNDDDDILTSTPLNTVILERPSASALGVSGTLPVSYRLDGVVNPNTARTFFVRISTYNSLDGTGTPIDTGTVAAATSTQIVLTGTMPESLVFCAGKTVTTTSGVPDCSTVTTGLIDFDRLFSPTDTALSTSQMAASTNAGTGYAITVNGPTLTSGSNTIAGLATPTTSQFGNAQFGTNVVLNDGTTVNAGPNMTTMPTGYAPSADPALANNATRHAHPLTGYDANGLFTFNSGNAVADSNSLGSDAQIYTNSYIVNVPGSQPAGTYSTTLTYICTATF
jgi:hypothetical protein